ncbi:two pore domain potassium channel family protein [Rhizobium leguminosarum]|uniref:potassium channel family protein n=1 Tax=Rhizobium leguminosarum TaxID=384 RepID=UPI000FF1B702|nr:potassium channel family protein [Rhizobium leguminosarum]RWY83947.1 two pore domain potassium channel family protein [Rhizobium leguminosarum]
MTVEQIAGAGLMVLFLADIFLTILYARAGTGLLTPRWNRLIWALVSGVAGILGRRRPVALSFAGPVIVVALVGFWALGLTVGAALIIRPELGTGIRPSSGGTPTDFVTALLVAGNSLSIVGSGDYSPHTSATRILFLLNSLIGASVLSLVLSYLVQVYSALRERNSLALTVDLMTGGTGDAAEMLARLGPGGNFSNAASELGNLARSLAMTKEAHHFYPLLFYFRFREPLYSVSRFSFILLDLTTLIDTTLDCPKHVALVRSAPVEALRGCARLLLATLDKNFPTVNERHLNGAGAGNYKRSYVAALEVLRSADISTQPDADRYAKQRGQWEPLVRRVGPMLGYGIDEIDCRRPANEAAISPTVGTQIVDG